MSELKLFPVTVNDFIPFLCFVVGKTSEQALKQAAETFPSLKAMGDLEVLEPRKLNIGDTFVVDPELYIIDDNEDVKYWLGDSSSYYVDNAEERNMSELFDSGFPLKESEDNDVKLLPAKTSEQNVEKQSTDNTDKESGDNSGEKDTEEKDKTLWV